MNLLGDCCFDFVCTAIDGIICGTAYLTSCMHMSMDALQVSGVLRGNNVGALTVFNI